MHQQEFHYFTAIARGWKRILLFAIASAVAGIAISFLFPLQYSSSMRLLIIQRQLNQTDPYTAIKASERISDNLAQIVYTTSFFDQVMNANFNVDESVFHEQEYKRRRQWREMIATRVIRGSGMLAVTVYHEDADQAEQISRAIAFVLTTDGAQYVGGGDLDVKLVDQPLKSRFPVKPNIPANAFAGLTLGAIAGASYVLLKAGRHRPYGTREGLIS